MCYARNSNNSGNFALVYICKYNNFTGNRRKYPNLWSTYIIEHQEVPVLVGICMILSFDESNGPQSSMKIVSTFKLEKNVFKWKLSSK